MKMKLDIHNLYLLGLLIAIIVFLIVIYFELKTIQNNIKEISKPLNSPQIPNNTLPSNEQNTQVLESVEFLDLDKLEDLESNNSKDNVQPVDPQATIQENNQTTNNINLDEDMDDNDEDIDDDEDEDSEDDNDEDDGESQEDSVSIHSSDELDSKDLMEKINNSQENDIDEMDEETNDEMEKKRVLNMYSLRELKKIAAENKIVQKGTKDELIDRIVKSTEFDIGEYIKNRQSQ